MATQAFREWLTRHEEDIALGIEGLAELRDEFAQVIGRPAQVRADESPMVTTDIASAPVIETTDDTTAALPPAAGDPATDTEAGAAAWHADPTP
jgi:hypothetical protein